MHARWPKVQFRQRRARPPCKKMKMLSLFREVLRVEKLLARLQHLEATDAKAALVYKAAVF